MVTAVNAVASAGPEDVLYPRFWVGQTVNARGRVLLDNGDAVQGAGVTFLFRLVADRSVQIELAGIWDALEKLWRCPAILNHIGTWEMRLVCLAPQRQTDWMTLEMVATPGEGAAPGGSLWVTQQGKALVTMSGAGLTGVRIAELLPATVPTGVTLPGVAADGSDVAVPWIVLADAAQATAAPAGKAAAEAVVATKLDRVSGGDMLGLLGLVEPEAPKHAAPAGWVGRWGGTLPSRDAAALPGAAAQAAQPRVRTRGYAQPDDRGGAAYRLVPGGAEPMHSGKLFLGGWREIDETHLRPEMFGAPADGVGDDTAAILAMHQCATALLAAGRPVCIRYNNRTYNAAAPLPIIVLDADLDIRGSGNRTRLNRIGYNLAGANQTLTRLKMTGECPYGVALVGPSRGGATVEDVRIEGAGRPKAFLLDSNGGYDQFKNCRSAGTYDGLEILDTAGVQFVNCHWTSSVRDNFRWLGGGEPKMVNCSGLGAFRYNKYVRGSLVSTPVEGYFDTCTWTVAQGKRQFVVSGVTDNGAGFARLNLGMVSAVSAVADRGCRFWGFADERVQAVLDSVGSVSGTGTLTALTASGINLLSAALALSVDQRVNSATIAASINAATVRHGYSAAQASAKVIVYAPDAQRAMTQWSELTWAVTGDTVVTGQTAVAITTSSPHGLALEDFVELSGTTNYDHVSRAIRVESDSTVCIRKPFLGSATGQLWKPLFLNAGVTSFAVRNASLAAYNGDWNITGCGETWVDLNVPYAGDAAGFASLPQFDCFYDGDERGGGGNDEFNIGGNQNYTLVYRFFNLLYNGTRLKSQKFVIWPSIDANRPGRIIQYGTGRGRGASTYVNIPWAGSPHGVSEIVSEDLTNRPYGSGDGIVIRRAAGNSPMVNGLPTAFNSIRVTPNDLRLISGASDLGLTEAAFAMWSHRIRANADHVNGWDINGSPAGARLFITARGDDANISAVISSKGTSSMDLFTNSNAIRSWQARYAAAAVNYGYTTPGAAGTGVTIGADGADANIPLRLSGKAAPVSMITPAQRPTYTVQTAPDPALYPRCDAWMSNKANGAGPVFSNGSAWIDPRTNAVAA